MVDSWKDQFNNNRSRGDRTRDYGRFSQRDWDRFGQSRDRDEERFGRDRDDERYGCDRDSERSNRDRDWERFSRDRDYDSDEGRYENDERYGTRYQGGYGAGNRSYQGGGYRMGSASESGEFESDREYGRGAQPRYEGAQSREFGRGAYGGGGGGQGWQGGSSRGSFGGGQRGFSGGESFGSQSYGGESYGGQGYGRFDDQARQQQRGRHFGKGPSGFKKSDQRIEEEVCEALMRHGEVDASNITVKVANGEVTLSGHVDSRSEKYLAEQIVEDVSGVKDVTDQLKTQPRSESPSSSLGGNQQSSDKIGKGSQASQSFQPTH